MYNFLTKVERAKKLLKEQGLDGWLLYDFRRSNPLACRFLDIPMGQLLTRRFFYFIPTNGLPCKIVSKVENPLKYLPGDECSYRSWEELHEILKNTLKGKIAMEFSPFGATPEISKVDGGTIDLIRKLGCEVVSSGDILQEFTCVWDEAKWQSHQHAALFLDNLVTETWSWIRQSLNKRNALDEYQVQQFMLKKMEENNFFTDHSPICAVNQHSADPHFEPATNGSTKLKYADWILIDLWCKKNKPGSVYADITRVGVIANKPTVKQQEVFNIVKMARDTAIAWIKEKYSKKEIMKGYEVDQVCRDVVESKGFGSFFLHRTGHNIDESDHGPGAHIDNLETHDERRLLPGVCFSIEPGIYLPKEFGVRLECNVYLHPKGEVVVTGGLQNHIEILI